MINASSITPTDEQNKALQAIKKWWALLQSGLRSSDYEYHSEFFLDGGAGTGKSTLAGLIIDELQLDPKNVICGAYTAKAARVMRRKGLPNASTLHSLLYEPIVRDGRIIGWRQKGVNSPLVNAELIIVDEVSMVSNDIAKDIRAFQQPILVLGDVDGQLPPISGLGAFTNRKPDFRLLEPHRTAADSPILRLAWSVRDGHQLQIGGSDVARVQQMKADSWPVITDRDWQVICGRHKTRFAVTRRARERYGFEGNHPLPGEPLICRRNSPSHKLFNGDFCTIWRLLDKHPSIGSAYLHADLITDEETLENVRISCELFQRHLQHDDVKELEGNSTQRHLLLDWSYAITCHSAQGSEFPNVIVIDDQFARWDKDLRRRWLYTAITRASEKLIVFQTG